MLVFRMYFWLDLGCIKQLLNKVDVKKEKKKKKKEKQNTYSDEPLCNNNNQC